MRDMIKTKKKNKEYFTLFLTFFKIGAFTFGGGYAMIPLIQKEVVDNHKWVTADDILEVIAIAESTPGPIAINAATFVGYKFGGFFGAFCATLGVVMPSFTIIALLSSVISRFQDYKAVQYAFFGIRAGVLALIVKAMINMYRKCPKNPVAYFIFAFSFIMVALLNIKAIYVLIGCALIGLTASVVAKRKEAKK